MRKKKSKIIEAAYEFAQDMYAAGAIDKATMREFDRLAMPAVRPLKPAEIRRIRERSKVSQALFAMILNISVSTVQKWEIGAKRPTGAALKLLHLVQKKGIDIVSEV